MSQQPNLPGAPDYQPDIHVGRELIRFRGWTMDTNINAKGEMWTKIGVYGQDKYAMMPLTDIRERVVAVVVCEIAPTPKGETALEKLRLLQGGDDGHDALVQAIEDGDVVDLTSMVPWQFVMSEEPE